MSHRVGKRAAGRVHPSAVVFYFLRNQEKTEQDTGVCLSVPEFLLLLAEPTSKENVTNRRQQAGKWVRKRRKVITT